MNRLQSRIRSFLRYMPLLTLCILLSLAGRASAADWAKNFGGFTGANASTEATATDASGNTYLAGYFDGATLTLGSVTLTRIGSQDAFVAKLDPSGTVLWAKNFGGSGASVGGGGIAVDGSGNVYLGGDFGGANLTTPALTKIGDDDAFALKLDNTGATTWARNFGGSGASASGHGIAVDGSGNVYLGGEFYNANLTTPALTKIGAYDAFALKLDSSGATTWARNFGGSGAWAFGKNIAVDGSGNAYLAGVIGADLTTPALTKIGDSDVFALKLDSSGATTWARNFGGSGAQAYANGIAVDSSGNVYLGGYFIRANLTTPALTKIGNQDDQDAFALKLDSSGATTWARNFGGSGAQTIGGGIAVDGSGNVYLGGYFYNANLSTPALAKIGNKDAFAFKLSSAGATIWAKNFGGSGASTYGYNIAVDGSGNVYLGGQFYNTNLTTPPLTKIGTYDAFALKLDSTGATTWARNFGGFTVAKAFTKATATDASGNTYLAGSFDSITLTLGSVTLTRIGSQDAFVAKLDPSGTVLWAKNFGGSGATAYGVGIAVDDSSNVYLGGGFGGANLTTPALTIIGNLDAFALKLDSSGATTWARNFGGSGTYGAYAHGNAIAVDGSGNVYLGGEFGSANLTTPPLTMIGDQDTFVLKLDSSGATIWARNFGGGIGAWTDGNSIAVDGSGNVYLGGKFRYANLTTPPLTMIGITDAFALKLDSSGAITWARNFGGSDAYANGTAIAVDGSGNVYLGGAFSNANLITPTLTKIGTVDAFALKLDSTGATTWARNFGGSGAQAYGAYGRGIAVDGFGNVYLGGYFYNANLTTPPLTKIGSQDAFALKLDSTGATTWAKNFGGSGAKAYGDGIAVDGSGNVYLGGNFQDASLTTPALTKIGANDAFIIASTIYQVTAAAAGDGAGAVSSNTGGITYSYPAVSSGQSNPLNVGTAVTVTATADAYSTASWSDCVSKGGILGGTITAATCQITLNSDITLNAVFAKAYPVASLTVSPNPAACGQAISFNGSASTHQNPARSITGYSWVFGDGTASGSGVTTSHSYSRFGTYTATLTATDDSFPARTGTIAATINVNQGNHPPTAATTGPYNIQQGQGLTVNGSPSSDPDTACGDAIVTYAWDLNNDGTYDVSGSNPTVTWTQLQGYNISAAGNYTIKLRVTDSFGATGTVTTTLTVAPPPTISGTPTTAATAGTAYSFTPTSTNANSFTITNKPTWANFNTATGALTGMPTNADAGTYANIVISATNSTGTTSLSAFSITVTAVNHAPTIYGSPTTSITAGISYNFTPTASDIDGDSLSFSIANKPGWAYFNAGTGTLSGTPVAGTYSNIQISVSDGNLTTVLPAFSITVSPSSGSGTPVPVMEGWWLVPGLLAGLGFFARRRKG